MHWFYAAKMVGAVLAIIVGILGVAISSFHVADYLWDDRRTREAAGLIIGQVTLLTIFFFLFAYVGPTK